MKAPPSSPEISNGQVLSGAETRPHRDQPVAVPEVSFIVAAYNVAPYVKAAVTTALQQKGVTVEVIVVDDASCDGTADAVAELANDDARITLVRRTQTGGPSLARNTAMDLARGTWLAILDADDLIAPERSRRLLDLAATTSADVVADNFERFFDDGRPARSTMIATGAVPYAFFVDLASFIRRNAMYEKGADLGYIKPMFRTAFMRANAIRHEEDIYVGEDYHLCLSCLLANARFVVTSESFYRYRIRAGSLSWRSRPAHIDRLLRAHEEAGLEERSAGDAELAHAGRMYVRALNNAKDVTRVVDEAKARRWLSAVTSAAVRPDLWRLLARFSLEALAKRSKWGT